MEVKFGIRMNTDSAARGDKSVMLHFIKLLWILVYNSDARNAHFTSVVFRQTLLPPYSTHTSRLFTVQSEGYFDLI